MSIRAEEAKKLYDEGRECLFQKKFKQSVLALQKAMQMYQEIGDLNMYVRVMNSLGVCYGVSGNETMAMDCYLNGLDLVEKYHIEGVSHLFYNNIGTRYQELGENQEALEYYIMARDACNDDNGAATERLTWYVVSYLNLALTYWYLKDYQNSERNLKIAIEKRDKYDVHTYDFTITILDAYLHYVLGDVQYAKEHMDEMLGFAAQENINLVEYIQDIDQFTKLLRDMKEYDKMYHVISLLDEVARKRDNLSVVMQVLEMYMEYYKEIGDNENYIKVCVEHAESYRKVREQNNKEKVLTLKVKIALHESERSAEEAKEKSERDALTGLSNRYAMQKAATQLIEEAKEKGTKMLVGILDIDCFKQFNDTYGHVRGDEVLRHVANILYDSVHGYGEAFRFGGDEFVILIPNATASMADRIAEKIGTEIFENPVENRNSYVSGNLTVSHGYYLATPKSEHDIEYYIDKADTVLYEVKKHGRNRFRIKENK